MKPVWYLMIGDPKNNHTVVMNLPNGCIIKDFYLTSLDRNDTNTPIQIATTSTSQFVPGVNFKDGELVGIHQSDTSEVGLCEVCSSEILQGPVAE